MTTSTVSPAVAQRIINTDRRNRRRKTGEALGRFAVALAVTFGRGWLFMLAVGIIHHDWIAACPTIAYRPSVGLCVLIGAALVAVPTAEKARRP